MVLISNKVLLKDVEKRAFTTSIVLNTYDQYIW